LAGEDFPEEEFFEEMLLPFDRIEALIFLHSGLYDMRIEDLRNKRREEILRIAARHGARNVRVFGSVARGEADSKSDLDLLVEFLPGSTLLSQNAMIRELESFLKVKVDVVSDRGLRERIRERVLAEAVPL
jgi:predicted nucleotidyltransferase